MLSRLDKTNGSIIRGVRRDAVFLVYMFVCVASTVPLLYLAQNATGNGVYVWAWVQTLTVILPALIYLLWPGSGEQMGGRERRFWSLLALSFVLWWIAGLLKLLLAWGLLKHEIDLLANLNFLFFYLVWLCALECAPHRHAPDYESATRRFLLPANILLAICLFAYFVLIPRSQPQGWYLSFFYYAGLDLFLIFLMLKHRSEANSQYWKAVYGVLILSTSGFFLFDLLEGLNLDARNSWGRSELAEALWFLPYLGVALAARVRRYGLDKAEDPRTSTKSLESSPQLLASSFVFAAVFLLIMHIVLELLGLIPTPMHRKLGAVVAISVLLFLPLAMMEIRSWRLAANAARARTAELQRLQVARQVDERSQEAKNQFLANVSHELRTPLNGILGMSEILLQNRLDADQRRRSQLIHSSAESLLRIIDDILEYSKIDSGEIHIQTKPFVLELLVRQVMELAIVAIGEKHMDVRLDLPEEVPADLLGDPSRLRQVLLNLLSNAVKFTPQGRIGIRFSVVERTASTIRLRCEIEDTGLGLTPEVRQRLFLPFSQGDPSASREHPGPGLGLAISRQIVEAQSGTIGAHDNPGRGATFWFEIPYGVVKYSDPDEHPQSPSAVGPETGQRILLAEDDVTNRMVVLWQLERLGLTQVDVVNDGQQVLDALKKHDYELILMDYRMPIIDARETTRRIRENGYSKSALAIVAMTVQSREEDRRRCLEAGLNDCVAKPMTIAALRTVVDKWLANPDKQH